MKKTDNEENFIFGGELSNLLDISFDIITEFGYEFAVNLNTKVGNKTANIFTDTTLTAISGQEIKFQNTDTYRYLEYRASSRLSPGSIFPPGNSHQSFQGP